jgi:hypothetical protein
MKTLSKNKQLFLAIVKKMNTQLKNPDHHLSKADAIALYDKEISPYGYPTHQSLLIEKGISMLLFNNEISQQPVDISWLETRRKSFTNNKGEQLIGEGFGKVNFLCPTYYITDDLADSLLRTEPPENMDINLEVLPLVHVVFSKKFNHQAGNRLRTVSIRKIETGIEVEVYYRRERPNFGNDIAMSFFIPFNGDGHCMFCDTKEYFKKNLLEKNYLKMRLAATKPPEFVPKKDLHDPRGPGNAVAKLDANGNIRFRVPSLEHEEVEEVINEFIEQLNSPYRFVINLLCLMTQEPEIISVQSPPSKYTAASSKGFNSEKINNVPNVHWLGEYFTTRVVDSKTREGEPQGGKPKKAHWRRGHWHTILQGPGRKQKTMKWFKPTFIRGHKQTEEVSK